MNLEQLLETIVSSSRDDWHTIAGPGVDTVQSGSGHSSFAAYIPDVAITLAWGLHCNDDFQEPWANHFPDPHAASEFVDVLYNGAHAYRDSYVSVDGHRSLLPIPDITEDGALEVSYRCHRLVRLLDSLEHAECSDFATPS